MVSLKQAPFSEIVQMQIATTAGSDFKRRYDEFLRTYPTYRSTLHLDDLRASDYGQLDVSGHTYLDYTAANLYADRQLQAHLEVLRGQVFGNPHSSNPAAVHIAHLVDDTRRSILEFFNASADDYTIIFTANASVALKLVGESYPFTSQSRYLLTFDNHNSVNGIREFARAKNATVDYVALDPSNMRIDDSILRRHFESATRPAENLFAFPAQSNFSGVQHPLEWIGEAQAHGWDVFLDAAAHVATNRLDLSVHRPEFVCVSFYKMFGYPTGVGCLLARKSALAKLRRPWFAGGTITVASVQADRHYFASDAAAFEDGTLNYLEIPAIQVGLQYLESLGIDAIHERVKCLTGWLLDKLIGLRHRNGRPLIQIYGPKDLRLRGGTIAFNFSDPNGRAIDHRVVDARALQANISIRTGCFCNPGGGEIALGLTADELRRCFSQPEHSEHFTVEDFRHCVDGKSTGAVRVSLGLASNFADVERFVEFAESFSSA